MPACHYYWVWYSEPGMQRELTVVVHEGAETVETENLKSIRLLLSSERTFSFALMRWIC